jgi:cobalt-zinc-cadmium efflux system membrane fusion protein
MTNKTTERPTLDRSIWPPLTIVAAGVVMMVFAVSARNSSHAAARAITPATRDRDAAPITPDQRGSIISAAVAHGDVPVHASIPGRIEFNANRVTPVFTPFSGRVVSLPVEVGTSVHEGDTLAMLDSSDVVGMQADYQEAVAGVRAARTSHDQAARTRDRATRLADVEAIPIRELQDAQASETRAAEDLRQAEAKLAAARGRLLIAGFSDGDISRLETGAPTITRLVPLKAAVSGTIVERHVGLGQVIQPGGDALLKIADLSTVWVTADVYEDQVAGVHPGAQVTIHTPAYSNETFTARVDRIAATLDPDKRTLAVRCVMPNADGRLKPGMFATVALQSGTIQRALLVPSSAVVASGNRREVFVEQQRGRYQQRDVEIGDAISGWVIVKSGLHDGERVVTQGGVLLARQSADGANR